MEHVFLRSDEPLAPSSGHRSDWSEWRKYDRDMPKFTGRDSESWNYWGWYTLVEVAGKRVLLFKSNTHLDWPGARYLKDMIRRLLEDAKPKLLLSIGTAGGARLTDHLGAVQVVNAGALYNPKAPSSKWPVYASGYRPAWGMMKKSGFKNLLMHIPATSTNLKELARQYNSFHSTSYTMEQLDPLKLNRPTRLPAINDLAAKKVPLLTTATFVVGTTDGKYKAYACIEMDDAVIGQVCKKAGVDFGFVRNISDPVQNAKLPSSVQGDWGSAVYSIFGMYTAYNGAVTAWGLLAGPATP